MTLAPIIGSVFMARAPDPGGIPQSVRDQAAVLWVACLIPSLHYVLLSRSKRRPIPFMPLSGVLFGLYYPLAPLLGVENLWTLGDKGVGALDPIRDYQTPIALALAGWIALGIGHLSLRRVHMPGAAAVAQIGGRLSARTLRVSGFLFLYGCLLCEVAYFNAGQPAAFKSATHFASQLACLGVVLLSLLSARGQLNLRARVLFLAGFASSVFFQLGSGATWKVMYVLFAFFLGSWIVRRTMTLGWAFGAAAAVVFCICVRGAMTEWRDRVWFSKPSPLEVDQDPGPLSMTSIARRSTYMLELVGEDLREFGAVGTVENRWNMMARRSAFEPLADVIRRTPSQVPYWDGATYWSLIGFAIPRVLWPDKPVKVLGQTFGHRYSYLAPDDITTAINLPFLVEFYANFGVKGVLCGMFLVGIIFRVLEEYVNRPKQSLLVTLGGVALFLPLLNIENDFSSQFGGLFMHAVALRLLAALVVACASTAAPGRRPAPPSRALPACRS